MNWDTYIKSYQSYLKIERGLSKNTIANYCFDMERLCKFLRENNIDVSPLKIAEDIIQEFIYSVAKEVNARSQARIISGLKSFSIKKESSTCFINSKHCKLKSIYT